MKSQESEKECMILDEIDTKISSNLTSGITAENEENSAKIGVLGVEPIVSLPSRIPIKKERTNDNTELSPISKSQFGSPDNASSPKEMHKSSRDSPSGIPVSIIYKNVLNSPQKTSTFTSTFKTEMVMTSSIDSPTNLVNELPQSPNVSNQNIESNTVDCMNEVTPQRRNVKRSSLMNATEMSENITTPIPKRRVSMVDCVGKSDKLVSPPTKVVKVAIRVRPFSQIEVCIRIYVLNIHIHIHIIIIIF
jgi:hypothetical protein